MAAVVAGLLGLNGSVGAVAVSIEWVDVGDVGNLADNIAGYGSVGYDYQISKYEVNYQPVYGFFLMRWQ